MYIVIKRQRARKDIKDAGGSARPLIYECQTCDYLNKLIQSKPLLESDRCGPHACMQ